MSRVSRITLFNAIVVLGVLLDQLTKAWARASLADGAAHAFIPGVMNLKLVMNTGAAFSIGEGSTWVFVILAAVIVVAAEVWVVCEDAMSAPLVCSLAAVASGGVGNLIDRVIAGQVTDFFATSFINFPVFNVADIFVTLGVVFAFICFMRLEDKEEDA